MEENEDRKWWDKFWNEIVPGCLIFIMAISIVMNSASISKALAHFLRSCLGG